MSATDWAQLASAIAAVGAFVAAAIQIYGWRNDALATRAGEIDGVALETDVVTRPIKADAGDGNSRWKYRFTVHNPGRFPITHVEVLIAFEFPVSRQHYDGTVDKPASNLEMRVPVVPAHGKKTWTRKVLVPHEQRTRLRRTQSSVTFTTPDAGQRKTVWPSDTSLLRPNKRLLRFLESNR